MVQKRGQITIFIVIAILIIALVVVVFLVRNQLIPLPQAGIASSSLQFENSIKECVRVNARNAITILSLAGGDTENELNSVTFKDDSYTYLCYTGVPGVCVNQKEVIWHDETQLEEKLGSVIETRTPSCINKIITSAEKNGFAVTSSEEPNAEVEIKDGRVDVSYIQAIEFAKGDDKSSFEKFDVPINSNLWDFVEVTNNIVNEKANCDTEFSNVDKLSIAMTRGILVSEEGNARNIYFARIYSLKKGQEEFRFATRSCVDEFFS
ncbi:MAG: hypothetical protein KJ767_01100 [Nanoarchaeota archaeon]|nr:hypothetical protein [Nanoarchaeota archaeon]